MREDNMGREMKEREMVARHDYEGFGGSEYSVPEAKLESKNPSKMTSKVVEGDA